jgi:hypothetical protein
MSSEALPILQSLAKIRAECERHRREILEGMRAGLRPLDFDDEIAIIMGETRWGYFLPKMEALWDRAIGYDLATLPDFPGEVTNGRGALHVLDTLLEWCDRARQALEADGRAPAEAEPSVGTGAARTVGDFISWLNRIIPRLEIHANTNDLDSLVYLETWQDAHAWTTLHLSHPDVELLGSKPIAYVGVPGWGAIHGLKRLRDHLTGERSKNVAPRVGDGTGRAEGSSGSGTRGRKQRYNPAEARETAEAWQRARDAGTTKKEFARDNSLSLKELNRILNRHAKKRARKTEPGKRSN